VAVDSRRLHKGLEVLTFSPSKLQEGLSLARFIKSSPALLRMVSPMANAYARAAGYRQMGLKYDDLIQEEKPEVQKALGRLTERESYDRAFRLKQAIQLSVMHRELPKENWLKPEEVSTLTSI
jgi:ubiquinol-cytochrome c reductase subunit 7